MTLEPLSGDLRAFAEDPGAFVAIGPDEERILTNRYSVTFTPGEHFWSVSVQRLRFGVDDVAGGVAEIRGLVADRGRNAAAWTVGPSATPDGLLELLVAMGMRSRSEEHTSELQSHSDLVCRLLLEKKKKKTHQKDHKNKQHNHHTAQ